MKQGLRQELNQGWLLVLLLCSLFFLLAGCENDAWNNPYPLEDKDANALYLSFSSRPHHLDPARSYSEPEWVYLCQIYEPPLQYHYLKRPYELQPLTAEGMPEIRYFNEKGERLDKDIDSKQIAYTEYWIRIKPGIYYQPHPAFAKNEKGEFLYHSLTEKETEKYEVLSDFKETGTRELVAEDYVYQIKRLAIPSLSSPIFGVMSKHIVGLNELRQELNQKKASDLKGSLMNEDDLRNINIEGAKSIDRYTYRIKIKGKYPQFRFWLAMPFFSPIPWEVVQFYSSPGLSEHNISLDWYPIGTGPYEMTENNPDRRIVLRKNPNFRGEIYPSEGTPADEKAGLLLPAGSKIPEVDRVIYTLEREDIPSWNKFLQGYYDMSGISSDNFGTAVQFGPHGMPEVTETLNKQHIRLRASVTPGLWSWGFNMLDDVIGGEGKEARALRQAISHAFDVQYFVDIFLNGRGVRAYGPIPPDIFGYETESEFMPKSSNDMLVENRINEAKKILKEAGIKEGTSLHMDVVSSGDPSEIAVQNFLVEQFRKLDLHLIIRSSDYNRYEEKLRAGTVQIFFWGWNADYPDPENFLFLFYGPNSSAKYGGENLTNYMNPEYDALFEKMRGLPDNQERLSLIQQMIRILHRDNPNIWGFYPKSYALFHAWMRPGKPSGIINNNLKYQKVDPILRSQSLLMWNKPVIWPVFLFIFIVCLGGGLLWFRYLVEQRKVRGRY